MYKVLHTIAGLHPDSGGPARTVPSLCRALAGHTTVKPYLLSQKYTAEPIVQIDAHNFDLSIAESPSKLALKWGWPLRGLLHRQIQAQQPDVLHDHGIWLPSNHYVAKAARRHRIPLVIHPRGMLEAWALSYRSWKKQLALSLYQRRDLETASLFFATALQEAESIRRLGLKQPVAVIPNGVEIHQVVPPKDELGSGWRLPRKMLFLSRIHPKKGLLNLVEAWARVRPTNWRLCLAGPDEDGHLARVMERVRQLKLESSVDCLGIVEGGNKAKLLASADIFVLPSYSENFGVVVAEALAQGVPVITTRGTPWQGLITHGCGWWIAPEVDALTETLHEALALDDVTLRAMGERGREYAREFDWKHIAQQTAEVYRWVLGQGPQPACVTID